ncbi:MAG: DUF2497 domain-containing protein [Pseudomonadota bacterium]
MSANPKPQEPSMDEILASIRRIISDDDSPTRREAAPPAKDIPPRRGLGDDTRFAPSARPEPPRRGEASRPESARPDPLRQDGAARPDPLRQDGGRQDSARQESARQEPFRQEPFRQEPNRQDFARPDASRPDMPRQNGYGAEDARPAVARPQLPRDAATGRESATRHLPEADPFADPFAPGLDRYDDAAGGWDEMDAGAATPYREDEDMADYPASGGAPIRTPHTQPAQPAAPRGDGATRPVAPRASESAARPFGDAPRRKDLLSPSVDAVVAAAFESLGDMVLPAHERTVEDLVKEILRPMLKEWLDAHLPDIVERLVRAEIERVSRTAR